MVVLGRTQLYAPSRETKPGMVACTVVGGRYNQVVESALQDSGPQAVPHYPPQVKQCHTM